MKLSEVYLGTIDGSVEKACQVKSRTTAEQSFDSFLDNRMQVGKSGRAQPQQKSKESAKPLKAAVSGNKAGKKDAQSSMKAVKPDAGKAEAVATPKPDAKPETGEEIKPAELPDVNTEAVHAEKLANTDDPANMAAMEALASALNLSVEELKQLFVKLDMQPTDLKDKGNMQAFLQAAYKVENPAALLSVPGVHEALLQTEQVIETLTPTVDADETLGHETVKADNVQKTAEQNAEAAQTQMQKPQVAVTRAEDARETPEDELEKTTEPKAKTDVSAEVKSENKTRQENDPANRQSGENPQNENLEAEARGLNVNAQTPHETNATQFAKVSERAVSSSNINTRDVVEQIVEKMKVEIKGNVSEMKITLRPEHLGDMSMKISTENGIVTAHFVAENQRVKEIIEANFNQLKDTLQEQGLQIANLSVSVGDGQQEQMLRQFMAGRQQTALRANQLMKGIGAVTGGAMEEQTAIDTSELYDNSVDYTA